MGGDVRVWGWSGVGGSYFGRVKLKFDIKRNSGIKIKEIKINIKTHIRMFGFKAHCTDQSLQASGDPKAKSIE